MRRVLFTLVVGLAAWVAWPASPSAQGTILFRMNYAASAYPAAGWMRMGLEKYGQRWTAVHVPGGGPSGQNAVELREIGTGVHDQHSWGWDGDAGNTPSNNGETRYYRWRFLQTSNSGCQGISGGGGTTDTSNKFLILGQGCTTGWCRVILNIKCRNTGVLQYNVAIDGGTEQTETGFTFPRGQWHNVQLEVRGSSSNGGWRLWVNQNAQSSPTLTQSGIRVDTDDHEYIILGGYNNHGLTNGGSNNFRITDFEVGTGFHSSWNTGGTTPPPPPPPTAPAAPTGVRIVTQ